MNIQSMLYEYLLRGLGLFETPSQIPAKILNAGPAIMVQNSAVNAAYTPGVPVAGRNYYALQVSGIASSDAFAIETSNDGVTWTAAPSPVVGNANGTYQFTGIYMYIRARKTGGTGSTTLITLMARS